MILCNVLSTHLMAKECVKKMGIRISAFQWLFPWRWFQRASGQWHGTRTMHVCSFASIHWLAPWRENFSRIYEVLNRLGWMSWKGSFRAQRIQTLSRGIGYWSGQAFFLQKVHGDVTWCDFKKGYSDTALVRFVETMTMTIQGKPWARFLQKHMRARGWMLARLSTIEFGGLSFHKIRRMWVKTSEALWNATRSKLS